MSNFTTYQVMLNGKPTNKVLSYDTDHPIKMLWGSFRNLAQDLGYGYPAEHLKIIGEVGWLKFESDIRDCLTLEEVIELLDIGIAITIS